MLPEVRWGSLMKIEIKIAQGVLKPCMKLAKSRKNQSRSRSRFEDVR